MTTHLIQIGETHTCINNASPAFETKTGANKYIPVKEIGDVVYLMSANHEDDNLLEAVLAENPYFEGSVSLENDAFEMVPIARFHDFFQSDNQTEIYEAIIEVSAEEANVMQNILDITEGHYEEAGRDSVIRVFDTEFVTPFGRFVTDIKVCNGDTPYVDPVLFVDIGNNHLSEINVLGVDDTLLGEYEFEAEVTDEQGQEMTLILRTIVRVELAPAKVEVSMNRYKIITLWATVDPDGGFIDVSRGKEQVEEWLGRNEDAVGITQGFGVLDTTTNLMPDTAVDFHYSREEAEAELQKLSS